MFGQATAQSRCQTSCSSKVIWKKIKFLDVESCWARAPVPHSWRSQCSRIKRSTNPDNSRSFWTVIWNLFTDFRFGVYIAPVSSFSLNDIGSSWTASFVLTLCRSVASQSHSNLSTCIEYLYYIIRSLSRYNSPSQLATGTYTTGHPRMFRVFYIHQHSILLRDKSREVRLLFDKVDKLLRLLIHYSLRRLPTKCDTSAATQSLGCCAYS